VSTNPQFSIFQSAICNSMARPTKLSDDIITAFERILNTDRNALVCTDQHLFFLLNDELPKEVKISYRTFQRYKMLANIYGAGQDSFTTPGTPERDEYYPPIYRELYRVFTHALIKQRNNIMNCLLDDAKGWQRYKWIMERKFRDWSLKGDEREEELERTVIEQEAPYGEATDYGIALIPLPLDNDDYPEYRPVPSLEEQMPPPEEERGSEYIPPRPSNTAWLKKEWYLNFGNGEITGRYKWMEPEDEECPEDRLPEEPPPLPEEDGT
jgi:hypothetical protein